MVDACFRKHLIVERAGRNSCVVKLMPTLVIDDEDLMEGMRILKEAFVEVLESQK